MVDLIMENVMCDIKKRRRRIDNVDRISALPEPILQLIMSFLPFKQLFQISLLSKAWLQAWRTYPIVEIDQFSVPAGPNQLERALKSLPYWENFLEIRHRNMVPISKLTLKTCSSPGALKLANRCICYAIENNVRELELEQFQPLHMFYSLPQMVLLSKSLNVLRLRGYKLELLRNDVKLSLRKLHLSYVYADDQVMNNLVAQCPLIENLVFNYCWGFNSLDIKALTAVSISLFTMPRCNVNITSCKNLKYLHIYRGSLTDEWLSSQISRLSLLEQLYISNCDCIESIKISSPSLKTLGIRLCLFLIDINIDTPNLSIFKYHGDVVSLSSGALTLSEADLCFSSLCFSSHNIDSQWYVKYIELLAMFHKFSKVLNLRTYDYKNVYVPGELRLILPHPLSGVKHLNFTASVPGLNFAVAKVMDFLLWISPHAETVCFDYEDRKKFYLQFTYKQKPVYDGETAQCCKSLPVTCWEHCIKKVEIEITSTYFKKNMTAEERQRSIKVERFVFEGENILEKIDGFTESGDLEL